MGVVDASLIWEGHKLAWQALRHSLFALLEIGATPAQAPLTPNFQWLPIAYHGRASSVVVSDCTMATR